MRQERQRGNAMVCRAILAAAAMMMSAPVLPAGGAEAVAPVNAELRQRCVTVLREALAKEPRWIKVHAAEYLLRLDHPAGVTEVYEQERVRFEREPQYRIGIWRVLAKADSEPRRSAAWVHRIRDVYLDPAASDRTHAVESLAKLGDKVPESMWPALCAAEKTSDPQGIFARWVLLNSGAPAAEARLIELLDSADEKTRFLGAYCLVRVKGLSPAAQQRVCAAAEREAAGSAARATLVGAAAVHSAGAVQDGYRRELLDYLRAGKADERIRVCEALAAVAQPADVPALVALLDDADPDLRVTAAWCVLRVGRRLPHQLGVADWIVLAVYMLGMLAVGWHYWRQSDNSEDYLLGGRTMKSLPVGLSLFATLFSTISYLAWPGEMIKHGPMILSMCLAYPLVAIVAGRFLIPHIMRLKITSAYELLEFRLGLTVRLLGSSLFLLLRILWMSMIIYATVGAILVPLLGWGPAATPWVCIALGGITLLYTAMGGLRAVVVTDVLQALILFAGAIVSILAVTIYLGGFGAWWPHHWQTHWTEPVLYDPNVRITFVGAVLATFTWYIATAGSDQMAIQRYLSTRNAKTARGVLNTSLWAGTLVMFLLAVLGLALLAYFQANPHLIPDGQTLYDDADQLFTRFIAVGLPAGFGGLVVAGLLAAAMSSLSAGINSSCSVIIADFVHRFGLRRKPTGSGGGAWLERWISIAIGVTMVVLSSGVGLVQGNLVEVSYKVVNLLSAPIFGLFCMAMFVRWATGPGTLVGAAAGLIVVVAVNFWEELTGAKGISFLWAMPLSFLVQMAVGMAASLLPFGRCERRLELVENLVED